MADPAERRRALAQLHIAVGELGMDEETYRGWLQRELGVASAGLLSVPELHRALELLRQMGWAPAGGTGRPVASAQARKIWALWHAVARAGKLRDGSNAACRAFIRKMTGAADPRFLDGPAANKVIEALKAIQARPARTEVADGPQGC